MVGPRVAVVIVNYNGAAVLKDCLASLRGLSYEPFDVLVVDNASSDHSVTMLQADFPEVTVIETGDNLGFSGGNNVGISEAMRRGAEYIFVLNNDTLVAPQCLRALVERGESDERIGAVSPRILFAEPHDRIWAAGGSYSLWLGTARHAGLRAKANEPRWNKPRAITFATGCAVLLRAKALQEVGLFDESLFMYNEDGDLSYRLRKAGWKIYYEPSAIVWHREAWTTSRTIGREWGLRLCVRNILLVHRKHASWYHKIMFYPYFVWRWLVLAVGNAIVHGRFDIVRGIVRGIGAYWRGEQGRPV
ncbi:MAG: glycosyltransferase family 2 protein [Candidatus Sumerlaeaceae bacterium]|jgi:GT2 family glycosyltransferase